MNQLYAARQNVPLENVFVTTQGNVFLYSIFVMELKIVHLVKTRSIAGPAPQQNLHVPTMSVSQYRKDVTDLHSVKIHPTNTDVFKWPQRCVFCVLLKRWIRIETSSSPLSFTMHWVVYVLSALVTRSASCVYLDITLVT
ncbi:hypothetical protein CHS0354_008143 [Potamilus streckersoni]|uniref:Uncharacterized protein n=1 Tax=Potamilus streckersoni TaxID=2493646 RepID=A0AAE0SIY2_9BIVA|nr:hypothetical protein CHS0354_008143 [Potamilus streckersoni]